MNKKYDVIVIGAGMAGMTAAIYLRRAGKSVLVLEAQAQGGQIINTVGIENWPGAFKVSGAELTKSIFEQMKELGAEFEYAEVAEIVKIEDGFKVVAEGEKYLCDAVILAMGTEPRKLSEKQMADVGERPISYCATCDGALYAGKPVVVVGSGNTAKHEIRYLENIASKVYHIHHDDPIPGDAAAVFVAIGRVPQTKFVKDLVKLNSEGYVVAGEDCKTSLSGAFVAGDCRTKKIRQLVTAAGDGSVAAAAAIDYLNKK